MDSTSQSVLDSFREHVTTGKQLISNLAVVENNMAHFHYIVFVQHQVTTQVYAKMQQEM